MAVMSVIRDAAGNIINIGPWDFRIARVQATEPYFDEEAGMPSVRPLYDLTESGAYTPRMRQEITNPLPDGAVEDTADIVTGWDGGLYEATDPRRLGPGGA